MSKPCLAIISSKNPTKLLLENVNAIKKFYPECDIVIVDSDSSDFKGYEKIPKDVKIEYVKNHNYEYGAYYYGYHKYPNYEFYILTQDSNIPIKKIPDFDEKIKDENILFHRHVLHPLSRERYEQIDKLYKDAPLSFIPQEIYKNTNGLKKSLHLANDNFLIGRKDTIGKILELEVPFQEKKIKKQKNESTLTEFLGGVMGDHYNKKMIDIKPYYKKVHGKRQ